MHQQTQESDGPANPAARRPKALLLPGASGEGSFWEPVIAHLPDLDCETIDWPGFGAVPANPSVASYADLADLTIARLERLGPSMLVGQSMGGVVATMVAGRRPDLVRRLVLVATSGGIDTEAFGAIDWRPGSRAANPNNPAWMWDERPDTTDALRNLRAKCLLIWATSDVISPLAIGEHLLDLIPNARLVRYESDDHWVARVFAQEVAHELRTHIKPTIGFLHTADVHVETFTALVSRADPGVETTHKVRPELLASAREAGISDPSVVNGVKEAIRALDATGVDAIVCTCSTVSGLAEVSNVHASVVRIDRPAAKLVVAEADRVVVVAAVTSTFEPTLALLHDECARQGRVPRIDLAPCESAWTLFESGDMNAYLQAIADHVCAYLATPDPVGSERTIVLLAQASMANAISLLPAQHQPRVVASPQLAVDAALQMIIGH